MIEARDFASIHPGEVLLHDFMEPMGLSQYRVAKEIGVPLRRINQIVHGERAISADAACGCRGSLLGWISIG